MTPHLPDEELSALVDGEAGAGTEAHVAGCAQCAARAEELRAVVAALTETPPAGPDPARREQAVNTALAAAAFAQPSRRRVVPLGLLAVAAVVVAVLVAVPLLSRQGGGRGGRGETAQMAVGDTNARFTDGGDLGDQADPQALGQVVKGAVEQPAAGAGGSAATGSGSGPGSAEATQDQAAATTTTRGLAPVAAPLRQGPPACDGVVRERYGASTGVLVYSATLRWQGTPSVVLAYTLEPPSGSFHHRVFVMSRGDCTLLTVLSL